MTNAPTSTPTTLPLEAGTWTLDSLHSSVGFVVRHLGISKVRGTFTDFTASLVVGETLDETMVEATVQLASIDTGNADRDAHTVSADLLDVAQRPTMTFRSTSIEGDGETGRMTGDLTIGGVTRPVTLDVEFGGIETFPVDGTRHAGFEATGRIDRHDYGLRFGPVDAGLGKAVTIELDMQFVAPSA